MAEKNVTKPETEKEAKAEKPERREFLAKTALAAAAAAVTASVTGQAQNAAQSQATTKALTKPIHAEVLKSEETKAGDITESVNEVKFTGADGAYQVFTTYIHRTRTPEGHQDVVVMHAVDAAGNLIENFTTFATVAGNVVKTKTIRNGQILVAPTLKAVAPQPATEAQTPQQIVDQMLARKGLN